jgi:hypothetical protein
MVMAWLQPGYNLYNAEVQYLLALQPHSMGALADQVLRAPLNCLRSSAC